MPPVKTMNPPLTMPAVLTAPLKKMNPGPEVRPQEGKIYPRGTGNKS